MHFKSLLILLLMLGWLPQTLRAQRQLPDLYGFRHYQLRFRQDTAEVLVKSRWGEERVAKPLLLFCQGSLPQPLLKLDGEYVYNAFPFAPDSLCMAYHLVIVGKPGVPLVKDQRELGPNFTSQDGSGRFPPAYNARNYLDYYVARNRAVLRFLRRQPWVQRRGLVVAGHSEGSTVAAHLAARCRWVARLIYSGGNPSGRMVSIVAQQRATETDSTRTAEAELDEWQRTVANPGAANPGPGDTPRATYTFSRPSAPVLRRLRIPVLVTYGTKDWGAPYVDLLRVELIRARQTNITFRPYIATEHNYFPVLANGRPNYEVFNWDRVVSDWLKWLKSTPPAR